MWTVDLARIYHKTLEQLKPFDLTKLPHKAKMHHFFADPKWDEKIVAVGASSSGKVGVLFLYTAAPKDPSKPPAAPGASNKPAASPAYVVKIVDAPQRILFAEYVLKNLAKAKIPKSLVVRLNWESYVGSWNKPNVEPKDSGMRLLNVLRDPKRRHPDMGSNQDLTYKTNLARLIPTSASRPAYLVVMKAFPLAKLAVDPFVKVVSDPFSARPDQKPKAAYELVANGVEAAAWLKAQSLDDNFTLSKVADAQRTKLIKDPDFQEFVRGICINKWILSNPEAMRKAGRALAASAFLRNGDILQGDSGINTSNLFFFTRTYDRPDERGKVNDPVGVIDNDTLATFCNLGDLPGYITGSTMWNKAKTSMGMYLKFVLQGGYDLVDDGTGTGDLLEGGIPGANLVSLVSKFDDRYPGGFFNTFFAAGTGGGRSIYPLCKELYADDGTLLNKPGSYPKFPDDFTQAPWPSVRDNLKKGFAEVLQELKQPKFLDDYFEVYTDLYYKYGKYGFDYNFDWTTLCVSRLYLTSAAEAVKTQGKITGFQATALADYADPRTVPRYKDLLGNDHPLSEGIRRALDFGEAEKLLDRRERDEAVRFFTYLSEDQQESFLIGPPKAKPKIVLQRIRVVRLALVVRCARKIRDCIYKQAASPEDAVQEGYVRTVQPEIQLLKSREKQKYAFYNLEKPSDHEATAKQIRSLARTTRLNVTPYFPEAWKAWLTESS